MTDANDKSKQQELERADGGEVSSKVALPGKEDKEVIEDKQEQNRQWHQHQQALQAAQQNNNANMRNNMQAQHHNNTNFQPGRG